MSNASLRPIRRLPTQCAGSLSAHPVAHPGHLIRVVNRRMSSGDRGGRESCGERFFAIVRRAGRCRQIFQARITLDMFVAKRRWPLTLRPMEIRQFQSGSESGPVSAKLELPGY